MITIAKSNSLPYLCATKLNKNTLNKQIMKTVNEMTDLEINKLFESILNNDKETKRIAKARKAKADFFNLNEMANNSEVLFF